MPQRQPNGLAWTLLALTVVLLAANVALRLTGGATWTGVFGFIPVTLSFALVGALIAVYDIDRLISRTVAYLVVTGLLIGVYAALVIVATEVLEISAPPAVAVSTLAAAALFSPLRRTARSSPCTCRYGRQSRNTRGEDPPGPSRRRAAVLLGRAQPRRARHRDQGAGRRRAAGGGAARPGPARQRRQGVHAGAGLRVGKKASAAALRNAIARVLDEPGYRAAARRMAATLAAERDEGLVVDELERAARSHPAAI